MLKITDKNFDVFSHNWALVTAGTPDDFNTMTVSWGSFGCIWSPGKNGGAKQIVTVYIKPVRYTHSFLEKNEFFTVSFFPEKYRDDLKILGSRSGRDCDKLALTGLTAKPMADGKAVGFNESCSTIVCRKIYTQAMDINSIPADIIANYYETEAPHTMFIGEVMDIENSDDE